MFNKLKRLLGIRTTTDPSKERVETVLFSGESAYFSNRVPRAFTERWVTHGGEISSGTPLDARARYFFAIDASEPWVMRLSAKSVVVVHVGWIAHCVDEAFRVPIAGYILDDSFVPGPRHKLINHAQAVYVPSLPQPSSSTESGPTPVKTSDNPSTPSTSIPRKRNREQAYFDSPSGSLIYSGFDKYGMPVRPRKQRKLRFDPSSSPDGRISSEEAMQATRTLNWLQDHGESRNEDDRHEEASASCGSSHMTTAVRLLDAPGKPVIDKEPPAAAYRGFSEDARLAESVYIPSALAFGAPRKAPHVRTIDFTKPPLTGCARFPGANGTNLNSRHADTILSVVKSTDNKVKTPKKISFADRARVRVYPVTPQRPDAKDGEAASTARQYLLREIKDELESDTKMLANRGVVASNDHSTGEVNKDLAPRTDSAMIDGGPVRCLSGDQVDNDTLTLTTEEVQAMRHRLLESAAKNGVDDGQLATLFELGKTFRGMTFRHVW